MLHRVLPLVGIVAVGLVLAARGDESAKPKAGPDPIAIEKEKAAEQQEILKQQYSQFERSLLRLAQRLERSSKPEDRERAVNLKKALALANDETVSIRFDKLISMLTKSKAASYEEITQAIQENKTLADTIQKILEMLMADSRDEELRREKQRIMDLIKELEKVIRAQKIARSHTEAGKEDKDSLGKMQNKVTKQTEQIAKAMGKDGDGKGKENAKGDGKGEGKNTEGKGDGKGEGKGQGEGKGEAKAQGQGQGQGSGKGQGQGQDQGNGKPQPNDGQQSPEGTPGKKQVQDANQYQKQAETDLEKNKRETASNKQSKAIEELEKARKQLEEILRQLREEELERLLAKLEERCRYMLAIQKEVWEGTVRIDKAVLENPDHQPTRVQEQRSLQLSDQEQIIVREADKALKLLENEGSAVAFVEAFKQVGEDATAVARRLGKVDVGSVTQVIEQDIIATLQDMIEALKKAQKDLQASKGQSSPNPNQNQKLIDLLAELKMIRAMQVRVNSRTQTYGRQYQGEQAADPEIQKELATLAGRQEKIFDITNNIARGKNK